VCVRTRNGEAFVVRWTRRGSPRGSRTVSAVCVCVCVCVCVGLTSSIAHSVSSAAAPTLLTRSSMSMWQERYESYRLLHRLENSSLGSGMTRMELNLPIPRRPRRTPLQYWRLGCAWLHRTFFSRVRSKLTLYAAILEGPLLAVLIAWTLRAGSNGEYQFDSALHIPSYLFLSVVVAMFFGLTSAATEILRDRPLLRRERNCGVFIAGYLLSKAAVMSLLALFQCALYLLVGNAILGIHDVFLPFLITMVLTALVGISMALFVSSLVRTERTALNTVPLLLVPQILLAGAMIPFGEMNPIIPWMAQRSDAKGQLLPGRVPLLSELCPIRYSYESMLLEQSLRNPYARERGFMVQELERLKALPRLNKAELDRLRLLRACLPLFDNLEVSDSAQAKEMLRGIRRFALNPRSSTADFEKFIEEIMAAAAGPDAQRRRWPLAAFFVNNRIDGLRLQAEAWRLDKDDASVQPIFLAKQRPLPVLGESAGKQVLLDWQTDTTNINTAVLLLMSAALLLASGISLRIQTRM